MWTELLKRQTAIDLVQGMLSPVFSLDILESQLPILDDMRDSGLKTQKKADFNKLIEALAKYSNDKDGFVREFTPRFRENMDIAPMKQKMDLLVERYGTKKRQSADSPRAKLNTLAQEIKEGGNTDKIDEFLKLAQKHPKILESDGDLRQLQRDLQKIDKGSILYFKAGNPSKKLLEKFAKIIQGEVLWLGIKERSWVIHYPNLTVGEWMKNWNSFFLDEDRNIDFTGEGSMGRMKPTSLRTYAEEFKRLSAITDGRQFKEILNPILVEIKSYVPTIESAGVSRKLTIPDAKFYEVNQFDERMLTEFIDTVSKTKGVKSSIFIPQGVNMSITEKGETITLSSSLTRDLVFPTKTGGNIRTNPYLSLLLTAIDGPNWFDTLLKQTKKLEIIDAGKLRPLLLEDAMKAFESGEGPTPLFKIPIDFNDDEVPEEAEPFKRWFMKQVDIGDISEANAEEMSTTVSPKMKRILDEAIENIGVKELLVGDILEDRTTIDFKEVMIGSLRRFKIVGEEDGEIEDFVPSEIKDLLSNLKGNLPKEELTRLEISSSVSSLLSETGFRQLMLSYPLVETAKEPLGGSLTLSSLSPKKLIPFFAKLDSLLGSTGSDSVLGFYDRIDKSKNKRKLIDKLESTIQGRILAYRNALIYFFEENLRKIINSKGVGDGKGQLPKKLLNKLVDKNIVTEVES